ncbi:MAG: sulfotransferase [Euryarchaeota archaeon]|nr:sulfotransferase [Euryarchaeota archaeon]
MVNYIVSGLERSGTSMMMQILLKGGMKVAYDTKRKPDEHNPRGYFELEGGKIINRLMEGTFPMEQYDDMVIKVTAYGIKYLPKNRRYKVIYMLRDLDEIMASMSKMIGEKLSKEDRIAFEHLNNLALKILKERGIEYITVNYNDVVKNPRAEIERVNEFLGGVLDVDSAVKAVDPKLYRNRKEVKK